MIQFALLIGAAAVLSGCASHPSPLTATSPGTTTCNLCQKPIPAGTGVAATVGGESRSYRCIHCALTGVADESRDVTLTSRTPASHREVRLTRHRSAWVSDPPETVFLILPEHADECLDVHQPFASRGEFDRYLADNPQIAAQNPRAFTIGQYAEMLAAGRPQ
jgi:hypothetical protein